MKWQTYKEWQKEGYHVMKGEKSILRDPLSLEPLFHEEQVDELPVWPDECYVEY